MLFFEVGKTLFQLLAHTLPSMFIGLYLANVLSKSGYLRHIGILMLPLSNGAKLPKGSSSVLTLCLLDKDAAFSMLSELNRQQTLSDKDVIIVSMLASLPLCVRPIIFFIVPTSFSILGLHIGLLFVFIYFSVQLLKAAGGMIAGHIMRTSGGNIRHDESERELLFPSWGNLLKTSVTDTLAPFCRMLKFIIPTLFIAILLMHTGISVWLSELAAPLTSMLNLPSSSCLVIISGLPSMMVGIVTAGPLIMNGDMTPMDVLRTLVITSLLHSLYNVVRMSFPVNISLFGARLGAMVTGVAGLTELAALPVLLFLSGMD